MVPVSVLVEAREKIDTSKQTEALECVASINESEQDARAEENAMDWLTRLLVPVVSLAAGVAIVALPGGCKSSSQAESATVRGRLLFQGQPVAGGMVVFAPDTDRGFVGKPARAETSLDGSYVLQLDGKPSIPPGWYHVALADAPVLDPVLSYGKPLFPVKLARPDHSGLVREVIAGQEHTFDFGVEVPTDAGL